MAWETALDRLLLQQVHLAEKGEVRPADVERQIEALREIKPQRFETAFHCGYARALLGIDIAEPGTEPTVRRWYLFGRVRGHDRRGERTWVADLLASDALMDLLQDPTIAAQCLPLVMRTLFWCEDLGLAVRALEYVSTASESSDNEILVDAAVTDLLTRLEVREDREDGEPTVAILEKCVQMNCFERLPGDVRAGYYRAMGVRQLATSEFDQAIENLRAAEALAGGAPLLRSSIQSLGALAEMRLHSLDEMQPRGGRVEHDAALAWLGARGDVAECVPDALFIRGLLAYENGKFETAREIFDQCLSRLRRTSARDVPLIHRTRFFLAAAMLATGQRDDASRALRLMDMALDHVRPDLESFYPVHEALKELDRQVALKFLDAVDIGRGTAAEQLLFVALEYLGLAEAEPASNAADRVLRIAVNLDQRIEAMRVLLTARNMQGEREAARAVFFEMRDLLMQRGAFQELENVLKNEESVGQALDHVETKCELVALYEEMEDREFDKASLQTALARSMRAQKDVESLRQALGILREVEIKFPELAHEDLQAVQKMLELADADGEGVADVAAALGRKPKVLVVGGNERQRRHHPRLTRLADEVGFEAEWLMANYSSPQKLVSTIGERLDAGVDVLVLLHWNRHETTEPALDLARKQGVVARTVHYAGFTSLQVCLGDMLDKLVRQHANA